MKRLAPRLLAAAIVATLAGQAQATVKVPLGNTSPRAGQPVWLRFPAEFLRVYA